jgi:hypothetical protein
MNMEPLTSDELLAIEARCEAASPGPWYPRATDDGHRMAGFYVGLKPGPSHISGEELVHDNRHGLDINSGDFDFDIIAITFLQFPRMVDPEGIVEDRNTIFIAHAREDVPRLIEEVRRLQRELEALRST